MGIGNGPLAGGGLVIGPGSTCTIVDGTVRCAAYGAPIHPPNHPPVPPPYQPPVPSPTPVPSLPVQPPYRQPVPPPIRDPIRLEPPPVPPPPVPPPPISCPVSFFGDLNGEGSCCSQIPYYSPVGSCEEGSSNVFLDAVNAAPCPSSPGGPVPVPVPDSGFQQWLFVVGGTQISGLPITCAETGVTLMSGCTKAVFFNSGSGTFSYSTPGGMGARCSPPLVSHNYTSGSASASPPQVMLAVPVTQI